MSTDTPERLDPRVASQIAISATRAFHQHCIEQLKATDAEIAELQRKRHGLVEDISKMGQALQVFDNPPSPEEQERARLREEAEKADRDGRKRYAEARMAEARKAAGEGEAPIESDEPQPEPDES